MAAPEGNQFWKARTKHGRDKLFESPDILWEACVEYFEWVEANPLWEDKPFNYMGESFENAVSKMRAMTTDGLYLFLNISVQTWHNYRDKDDFVEVTSRTDSVIRSQKFSGAAANLLNANIIARDLGLTDKSELKANVSIEELGTDKLIDLFTQLKAVVD